MTPTARERAEEIWDTNDRETFVLATEHAILAAEQAARDDERRKCQAIIDQIEIHPIISGTEGAKVLEQAAFRRGAEAAMRACFKIARPWIDGKLTYEEWDAEWRKLDAMLVSHADVPEVK